MVSAPYNPWPAAFRRLLGDLGVSQKKLADDLGISDDTINRWANGHSTPQLKMQLMLIEKLKLTESGDWQRYVCLSHYRELFADTVHQLTSTYGDPKALSDVELLALFLDTHATLESKQARIARATIREVEQKLAHLREPLEAYRELLELFRKSEEDGSKEG